MPELTGQQHLALAEALVAEGRPQLADQHYRAASTSGDPAVAAAASFRLARRAEHGGRWQEAEELYARVVAVGSDELRRRAAFFLGALRLLSTDPAAARDSLAIASQSDDPLIRPWALVRLGDACLRLDDCLNAYRAYDEASRLDNETAAYWARAQILRVAARLKEKHASSR